MLYYFIGDEKMAYDGIYDASRVDEGISTTISYVAELVKYIKYLNMNC